MTTGHAHHLWTVKKGGLVQRVLRTPLLHFNAPEGSKAMARVERSPYPYGPCPKREGACFGHHHCWVLTPLGILHRWTGLTLYFPEEGST